MANRSLMRKMVGFAITCYEGDLSEGAAFFYIRSNRRSHLADLGVLRITAACENANESVLQRPRKAAGTQCPIIERAQRRIGQDFRADNVRADIQQFTNIHE